MSIQECLEKKTIVKEFNELTTKTEGVIYTFKVGDKVERLTIVKLVQYLEGNTKRKGCICQCDCGNYIGPSRIISLINGDLRSCGCYQRELHSEQMKDRNFKHGYAKRDNIEHLYTLWCAMIDRATNFNRWDSKYYAAKGIKVCEDWRDYLKFREWAMNNGYAEGMSIDRIDNSLGYNPDNCRWIPLEDQNRNKTNNHLITIGDKTQILSVWCRECNIDSRIVSYRLSKGWSVEKALDLE